MTTSKQPRGTTLVFLLCININIPPVVATNCIDGMISSYMKEVMYHTTVHDEAVMVIASTSNIYIVHNI